MSAARRLEDLVEEARLARLDEQAARNIVPLVDLTSLSGTEEARDIELLCERATRAGVAAVCIHAVHLPLAKRLLGSGPIRLATVVAFPEGGDDVLRAAEDTAAAVKAGAGEIDVVAPLTAIGEGDIGLVGELVEVCRAAAGKDVIIKLILETGALRDEATITAVARVAVMAGVDFLKTSTGKIPIGATLEAAAALLAVIEEAGGEVGLKVSGGIRTGDQAAGYLTLAESVMGRDWISPTRLRFGASSLLDQLSPEP